MEGVTGKAAMRGGHPAEAGTGEPGPRRLVMALGSAVGRALSWLALGAIYWLALVPVALLARLTGKRFLSKGKDPSAATYWVPREMGPVDRASLERQF